MTTEHKLAPANNLAIDIENISKTFKNLKALDRVSLKIFRNEVFGLLGPNGSGKTTLLRILSTLVPPDPPDSSDTYHRKCNIMGYDLFKQMDDLRRIIGYVPQRDALYGDLSALDNLLLFSTPYDLQKSVQMERIEGLLKLVELYDRRHALAKTFSGGMLKRLSISCALVHRPAVLFLDEITVGLDTPLRREIWSLLRELKKQSTVVITTHYVPDAENYCDRVALILDGHVLDCGKPSELISKYPDATSLEEVTLNLSQASVKQ
jgi:ABC-2 type transport system ATP-binding protein